MYLKEFRERIGLSQKEFAKELGLTQVTIARYETNKMNPTTKVIQKYIERFKANPNYLFLGLEPYLIDDLPELNNESINIINELNILMTKNEIKDELEKVLLEKIVNKFKETSSSLVIKFLTILQPHKPLLFMYYIAQMIEYKITEELEIESYKDFLCLVIKDFPVKKLSFNQEVFTKEIKKEFIQIIKYKLTEDECELLVSNYKNILDVQN